MTLGSFNSPDHWSSVYVVPCDEQYGLAIFLVGACLPKHEVWVGWSDLIIAAKAPSSLSLEVGRNSHCFLCHVVRLH